jgi:hypothetical protein
MSSPQQQQRRLSSSSSRSSLKQTSADAMRRKMNTRRQDRQNLIRKQKKSDLLWNTRRRYYNNNNDSSTTITASTTATTATTDEYKKLSNLAMNCLYRKDSASLALFEAALATRGGEGGGAVVNWELNNNEQQELTTARELCDYLGHLLQQFREQPVDAFLACRVLTNLAAMDSDNNNKSTNKTEEDCYSYYGRSPSNNKDDSTSWGTIIVQSQAWSALLQILNEYDRRSKWDDDEEATITFLHITRQACWVLGNLTTTKCSSSSVAMEALGRTVVKSDNCQHVEVCQMATWAIHMMLKMSSTGGDEYDVSSLWNVLPLSLLLARLVSLQDASFMEVSVQACWIVAHLTSRETDEWTEQLLCNGDSINKMIPALLHSLEHSVVALEQSLSTSSTTTVTLATLHNSMIDRIIPCLRAVGNIATACQGKYVPELIVSNNYTLASSLATLLDLGSKLLNNMQEMAVEAAWAAGTILCDAGVPEHPSTTSASRVLLSWLCIVIDYKTSMATLELKREALSALWNMVTAPPFDASANTDQERAAAAAASRPKRGEFLVQITLQHNSIESLVQLMQSQDADVVYFSLSLLNAILRQTQTSSMPRQRFLFAKGVDALESICDGERQDECADMAADLIDDFFSEEILNDDEVDEEGDSAMFGANEQLASGKDAFSFGVPDAEMPQVFDFSQQAAVPTAFSAAAKPGAVGRGRGKTLPAWMLAEQQQR